MRPCLLASCITLSLGTFLEPHVGHQEQKPPLDLQKRNKLGSLEILKQDTVRLWKDQTHYAVVVAPIMLTADIGSLAFSSERVIDEKWFNENKPYLGVMREANAFQICYLSEISIGVNRDSLL